MNYFPLLKSKRGEFLALKELSNPNKLLTTPYIELIPEAAEMTLAQLSNFWNFAENNVIIDPSLFLDENHGIDDYFELLDNLISKDVNPIPVVELDSDDTYIDSLKTYIDDNDLPICIRIRNRNLRPRTINSNIEGLLAALNRKPSETILVLDFGLVNDAELESKTDKAIECIENINSIDSYIKVVVASGSFPPDLGDIVANTRKLLPRYEWKLWLTIVNEFEYKTLAYGDYGIKHPYFDGSVARFEGTCSIKYTTEDDYLIYRGIKASNHRLGGGQYHEKCRLLIADPLYDGAAFSWGDNEISDCSGRAANPGNAETWVKIGHNHHFTKILDLL